MRSPDQKPLITAQAPRPGKLVVPKATPIAHKEDPQITAEPEIFPPQKVRKESRQKNEESVTASGYQLKRKVSSS